MKKIIDSKWSGIALAAAGILMMVYGISRGEMAVVFTKRPHTELMTCEDVVATGRYPYTGRFGVLSAKDHEAVQEAMEAVHVLEFRDRDFAKISDGQRQRILLARAICQQPEILLLDEPTSYLDIKYKLEFLSVLQELQKKKGLTVILSLHELELAARVSDRILCVDGAFVEQVGTPEEVFRPGHLSKLFQITQGSFEEESQEMELAAVKGTPEEFVIAGNGSGRGFPLQQDYSGKTTWIIRRQRHFPPGFSPHRPLNRFRRSFWSRRCAAWTAAGR